MYAAKNEGGKLTIRPPAPVKSQHLKILC